MTHFRTFSKSTRKGRFRKPFLFDHESLSWGLLRWFHRAVVCHRYGWRCIYREPRIGPVHIFWRFSGTVWWTELLKYPDGGRRSLWKCKKLFLLVYLDPLLVDRATCGLLLLLVLSFCFYFVLRGSLQLIGLSDHWLLLVEVYAF